MSDSSPRLGLPDLPDTPELYADTVADAFARLDAFTDMYLLGQFVDTPPSTPADGDAWLIGGSPTGAWSGSAYKIATCRDGGWAFLAPFNGLRAFVESSIGFIVYKDGAWLDWNSLLSAAEGSIASAATCDIGAAGSLFLGVTGTTTITSFGTAANRLRFLRFAGSLTLTHNATSLVLPGGANVITAAGDTAIVTSDGSGNWRCRQYARADGRMTNLASPAFTGTVTVGNSVGNPALLVTGDSSVVDRKLRLTNTQAGGYTVDLALTSTSTNQFNLYNGAINIASWDLPTGRLTVPLLAASGTADFNAANCWKAEAQTTGPSYWHMQNSGGQMIAGLEGSGGAALISGGLPYAAVFNQQNNKPMHLGTNNAIAVTIGTDESVLLGTTANGGPFGVHKLAVVSAANGAIFHATGAGGYNAAAFRVEDTSALLNLYYYGSSGIGSVSVAGGGTGVAYNTSSDARLKRVPAFQAGYRAAIQALWVGDFTWKDSGAPGFGVLAQQAWEVMPHHLGVTPPADEAGVWQASAEPFGHLALWGAKDLYALVEALAARVAVLEAAHAAG